MRWCTESRFTNVISMEHSNAFLPAPGTANCVTTNCRAYRSINGNGSGWDYFIGFAQDNTPVISGYASGNASIYHTYNTTVNNATALPGGEYGLYVFGGFSDTFIHGLEIAGCAVGIQCQGTSATGNTDITEDLKISECVIDDCASSCIVIVNADKIGQVLISDNYLLTAAGNCLFVVDCNGLTSITGNQMWSIGSGGVGLNVETSSGVSSVNNIITDMNYGVVFNGVANCRSMDSINSINETATAGVLVENSSSRCVIAPLQKGTSTLGGLGVSLDSTSGYCSVDPDGIDPVCLTGGASANKIVYNGTQITATGTFGTTNFAKPGIYA